MTFMGMTLEQVVETLTEMEEEFDFFEVEGEVLGVMLDDTTIYLEDGVVTSVVTDGEF